MIMSDTDTLLEELVEEITACKLRIFTIEEKIKYINCEYNKKHIDMLHAENEGLSMVYGDAYLVKLREMEDNITKIKDKLNELVIKYNEKNYN